MNVMSRSGMNDRDMHHNRVEMRRIGRGVGVMHVGVVRVVARRIRRRRGWRMSMSGSRGRKWSYRVGRMGRGDGSMWGILRGEPESSVFHVVLRANLDALDGRVVQLCVR